jgi:hypothetical protein
VKASIGGHSTVVFGETRLPPQRLNRYSCMGVACTVGLSGIINYEYRKKRVKKAKRECEVTFRRIPNSESRDTEQNKS